MSQLKQRFIRDLKLRNFSPKTVQCYVCALERVSLHFGRCPSGLSKEELKSYLELQINQGKGWATINNLLTSFKHFYCGTLGRSYFMDQFKRPRHCSKLPTVLSLEEVERLIQSIRNIKHRVLVMTMYSAGLRVSEVIKLKIKDIDSARGRIIIRQPKGNKDREVPLSARLLKELRQYYLIYRPNIYLFNGQTSDKPISDRTTLHVIKQAAKRAKLTKQVSCHTLRHSFATHMMNKGIDIRTIQILLGHKSIKTTMRYCHLSSRKLLEVKSPLEDLNVF